MKKKTLVMIGLLVVLTLLGIVGTAQAGDLKQLIREVVEFESAQAWRDGPPPPPPEYHRHWRYRDPPRRYRRRWRDDRDWDRPPPPPRPPRHWWEDRDWDRPRRPPRRPRR